MKNISFVLGRRQRGVALITVLFLFALATIIISGLVTLLHNNTQRASAILESEQASLLCLSGEEWARQFLAEDFKANNGIAIDHIHEKWAEDGKILEVENGYIEVSIQDAQGKFNLNNLVNTSGVADSNEKAAFQRLIDLSLGDAQLSATIAGEAVDWLDADSINGIEEADYLSEVIPYRPPNSMVTDVSELRWLKDMDQRAYKLIHQDIFLSMTALPKQTLVNINTAQPAVVAALAGISLKDAEGIVKDIQANQNGFSALPPMPALQPISSLLTFSSEYFEVRIRTKFADHYAFMKTIIFRDHQTGEMDIISRDRSERFIFPFSKDYNDKTDTNYEFEI